MNEKRFITLMWAVKVLLVVVLLYIGFGALTSRLRLGDVLIPAAASGDEQTDPGQADTPETSSGPDYSAIVQRNLFTGNDLPLPPTTTHRSQILDTMPSAEELGLRVIGIVAGPPAASLAIIRNTQDNTTHLCRIGEVVASATVESIQRDAVILRYQGRQLVLRSHTGADGQDKGGTGREEPSGTEPAPVRPQGRIPPLSTQARYVEEVFHNITIEPYVKNSQTQGLKVSGLEKVPLAEMFGFRNGDIIQTINGQQLTSKQKAFQVLMKAKTQPRLDIQLLRNGKNKSLSFEI
jgi:type II secretion system protein C